MKRDLGIAYCGLACAVCDKNKNCAGCRADGCKDKAWCKNLRCCREKGLQGCWECGDFPCEGSTVSSPRARVFVRFVAERGEAELLDCLARNEAAGVAYHDPGRITGDYDRPDQESNILRLLLEGPEKK